MRIVNKGRTFSYKYFLDFEEKYRKISDYRMFNYFKTLSGCRTFSHFIAGTLATLTVCITILICCFAKITTSIFRAQASLHGQETSTDPCSYLTKIAHFNLKKKKIDFFTLLGMLARIFVFLFRNNRSLSVYIKVGNGPLK